jgi:hypothetical protein
MIKSWGEYTLEELVVFCVRQSANDEKLRKTILNAIESKKPWGLRVNRDDGKVEVVIQDDNTGRI